MAKRITTSEYKRRVFNTALLECMSKIHGMVLNGDATDEEIDSERATKMASDMAKAFFNDEMKLDTTTIDGTKKNLADATSFIKDCVNVCEAVAEQKAEDAAEEKIELEDDQKVELSDEDKALIDKLFDEKTPDVQVAEIRDATVAALLAEDRKAQEIRDGMAIANSKVAGGDPKAMQEAVNRLDQRGPTSLMNAIINSVASAAVHDVNENGTFVSVGKVMEENANQIKFRAAAIYALYETASVFGIHKYVRGEVEQLAKKIYYGKD